MGKNKVSPSSAACAKWWADLLRNGSGMKPSEEISADDAAAAKLLDMLLGSDRKKKQLTEGIVSHFETLLARGLETMLRRNYVANGACLYPVCVRVDYHPDLVLQEAANEAGIGSLAFVLPMKAHTEMTPNKVEAALGYGTRLSVIWTGGTGGNNV